MKPPLPEGYVACAIETIDAISFVPDGRRALILFTSDAGQKICVVAKLDHLARAVQELYEDAFEDAGDVGCS